MLASDYNKKGTIYRLTNHNFDIITAGNAMKYASVVKDNGDMDFSTVTTFVDNAREAGVQVYGHTLCWHEQQNPKYLNGLIKDRDIDAGPDGMVVEDAVQKFEGLTKYPFYVMGYEPAIIDGILTAEYPGSWYQFFIMDGIQFEEGREYTVTAKIQRQAGQAQRPARRLGQAQRGWPRVHRRVERGFDQDGSQPGEQRLLRVPARNIRRQARG